MSVATLTTEATFVVEYSFEATTLDYLSPRWMPVSGVEPFASQEAAEAHMTWLDQNRKVCFGTEMVATRVRRVPSEAERQEQYDADAAFTQRYWADQARAAAEAEAARKEMFRRYGRESVVRVVKGRKVPVGTEGEVFWLGDKGWGYSVGFKTAEGEKHFTALGNVESVRPAYEQES